MSNRHLVGGHIALPGSFHVVEDARMLNVLTRVDDGARRRTHLRRALVINEVSSVRLEVFASRDWKWPFLEEVFLVNEDEQNVVTCGGFSDALSGSDS